MYQCSHNKCGFVHILSNIISKFAPVIFLVNEYNFWIYANLYGFDARICATTSANERRHLEIVYLNGTTWWIFGEWNYYNCLNTFFGFVPIIKTGILTDDRVLLNRWYWICRTSCELFQKIYFITICNWWCNSVIFLDLDRSMNVENLLIWFIKNYFNWFLDLFVCVN